MEAMWKTIRLDSPATGEKILAAMKAIVEQGIALPVKREAILKDGKQAYTIGFEALPVDPVLWFVIGHGPAADRNLFLDQSYGTLYLRTEKNLNYKPTDEAFEQKLVFIEGQMSGFMDELVEHIETILLRP